MNELHATIEQLLDIKDGLKNDASLHVRGCTHCKAELGELAIMQQQLQLQMLQQANCDLSPDLWQRITQSAGTARAASETSATDNIASNNGLIRENSGTGMGGSIRDISARDVPMELLVANGQQQHKSLNRAIYTLAASILVTGFIGLFMFGQQGPAQQQDQFLQASIQELMLNSRGMERALQKVSLQNELLTVAQRSVVDRLYWRLANLDQMINDNASDSNDPVRIEALWNERVDALTELNQLYYSRQQTLDDSEI